MTAERDAQSQIRIQQPVVGRLGATECPESLTLGERVSVRFTMGVNGADSTGAWLNVARRHPPSLTCRVLHVRERGKPPTLESSVSAYLWHDQCEAAHGIKERFGSEKALGYLLGEKLLNFLRASDHHPRLAAEPSKFVAEIKTVFEPWEIREYLSGVRRLGALGHVSTEEQFEEMRAADAILEDIVTAAEDVLLVERMKILLLGDR